MDEICINCGRYDLILLWKKVQYKLWWQLCLLLSNIICPLMFMGTSNLFQLGKNKEEAAAKRTTRPRLLSPPTRRPQTSTSGEFRRLERQALSLSPSRRQSPPPPTSSPHRRRSPQRGQSVSYYWKWDFHLNTCPSPQDTCAPCTPKPQISSTKIAFMFGWVLVNFGCKAWIHLTRFNFQFILFDTNFLNHISAPREERMHP